MRTSLFFLIIFKSFNTNKYLFSSAKTCMDVATPSLCVYYITINNYENAIKLANILLDKKLVACSNIIGTQENPITSIYRWKGNIESDKEILMMSKSRAGLLDEITKEVIANHPYSVPEIIATPIIGGNPEYIKWVIENTKEPDIK